ncbi:hypothetical protein Tco_0742191 [Tanacetum coccineum]
MFNLFTVDFTLFRTINDKYWNIPISPDMKIVIEQKLNPTAKRLSNAVFEFYQSLKEEMVEDLKYFKSLENEVDHMNAILCVYTTLDQYSDMPCDYLEALEKSQLQDKNIAIHELKQLIAKLKGKSMDTKFENLSVPRQMNAFKFQKPSFLGRPTPFSNSLEKKDFSKSRVIPTTSVSRPQLKSTQLEDRVMRNNSQVKTKEVEDQCKIFKFSNKTYVTACNDSLNAKTSNVNSVCGICDKCVFNANHDSCVLNYINSMNSRTKKPTVVPISTRTPKQTVNQSVATSHRRTVASESTIQKPRSTFRKLYEHFGNYQFARILGYGDLVQGNITIKRVCYVEGLNHNLFSIGQFCDADLEVAFRKSTCYIRDLKGNDLLTGSRGTYLY